MLSFEQNEKLTRVGRGTPMGEYMRRFWIPALLSDDLGGPDGDPVRARILGEDLVAFRATGGTPGIVSAYCAHRGANLFWARNEDCGLRCIYHGWKFDASGACVDIPHDPPESTFKDRVRIDAYPTRELGGAVWVYMGPRELMPDELPKFAWATSPMDNQHVTQWIQESNWLQAIEGEFDPSHLSYLHAQLTGDAGAAFNPARAKLFGDGKPTIEVEPEDYGFSCGARRSADEDDMYYWRVSRFLLPFYSVVADADSDRGGRCFVPIDDNNTMTFAYRAKDAPYSPEEDHALRTEGVFPPRVERGSITLVDGYTIDAWLPVANKTNDYEIDREKQRTVNFTGMVTGNDEDRAVHETMLRVPDGSVILDRSKERLTAADKALSTLRRVLLRAIDENLDGTSPELTKRPDVYSVRAIDAIAPEAKLADLLSRDRKSTPVDHA